MNKKQNLSSQRFKVDGMSCASCVSNVKKALSSVNGVVRAEVNLATEVATVEFLPSQVTTTTMENAVKSIGYSITHMGSDKSVSTTSTDNKGKRLELAQLRNQAFISIFVAILLMVLMNYSVIPVIKDLTPWVINWIMFAIATPVQVLIGRRFYSGAWHAFRSGTTNMNTLISIGITAAYVYSVAVTIYPTLFSSTAFATTSTGLFTHSTGVYYEVPAFIIGFVILGRWLEKRTKASTVGAVTRLAKALPKSAILITDNELTEVPVESVTHNATVLVKPGQTVPVDGVIIEGSSSLDESLVTGESLHKDKGVGDIVLAGTYNGLGSLKITAKKVGSDTVVGQVMRIVEQAQSSRAPIERLADAVTAKFVPVVLLIAAITFVFWVFLAPDPRLANALLATVGVLVVACPCALGLATPMAVVVAIGRAAKMGIIVKEAAALEIANSIKILAIDKTGTITQGKPSISEVVSLKMPQDDLIKLAASVDVNSEHPLASATVNTAKERQLLPLIDTHQFKAIPGMGAQAICEQGLIAVGNIAMMRSLNITKNSTDKVLSKISNTAQSIMFVTLNNQLQGAIAFADSIKPYTADAIQEFHSLGVTTAMLTGDNIATATQVAKNVGIKQVYADMLPDQKSSKIQEWSKQGKKVSMVGDGINDAPSMVLADQGISMGSGADITVEKSQVTVMSGDLRDVVKFMRLSHLTITTIKQNLFFGFFYNVLLIPIAAGALYPLFSDGVPVGLQVILGQHGYLNPVLASGAMAFSSLSVILNSLRMGKKTLPKV